MLYYLHCTSLVSFHIDVVLTLFITLHLREEVQLQKNNLLYINWLERLFLIHFHNLPKAIASVFRIRCEQRTRKQATVFRFKSNHYNDDIMSAMVSQITSPTIVYWTLYSSAEQRKHQNSASLAFVRGIHQRLVNSLHRGPVTRKIFLYDDVTMYCAMA